MEEEFQGCVGGVFWKGGKLELAEYSRTHKTAFAKQPDNNVIGVEGEVEDEMSEKPT